MTSNVPLIILHCSKSLIGSYNYDYYYDDFSEYIYTV